MLTQSIRLTISLALLQVLLEHEVDNVGGVWDTQPGAETLMARIMAVATTSPFGVGGAQYRLGSRDIQSVDTVPFGCYRREVFERIGLFDERTDPQSG